MAITKSQRQEIEALVIKTFDIVDKSKVNSEYYKNLFANMDDKQFEKFISKRLPFRFMMRNSVTEPTMADVSDALKYIGVPLMEKIALPYLHSKDGKDVMTQEAFVGYTHHKKVQQIITKKNKWSVDIAGRDMKTGRLVHEDKGAATSDREMESLVTLGLDKTLEEFAGPKADSMLAKNVMYKEIDTMGQVRLSDLPKDSSDSIANNLISAYMIGAHLYSNIVNTDYYTPYTLKKSQQK